MESNQRMDEKALARLNLEWGLLAVVYAVFLVGLGSWLGRGWRPEQTLAWGGAATWTALYQLGVVWRRRNWNARAAQPAALLTGFGLANWITLIRGILLAALAGFLFAPRPSAAAAWAPGVLYLAAILLDFCDGAAARLTGRTTRLGELLDMEWDSIGVLAGSLLAVVYGQAPWPYLAVGLARYAFVGGLWLRRRRGLPVFDLPPSMTRRALAALQMGLIAGLLFPVFAPPVTWVVLAILTAPFLLGFYRDWLAVCGDARWKKLQLTNPALWATGLRVGLCAALATAAWRGWGGPTGEPVLWLAAAGLVAAGAAGRAAALATLLGAAAVLTRSAGGVELWATVVFSALTLLLGTGRYSAWTPEDGLIYKRVGDRRAV